MTKQYFRSGIVEIFGFVTISRVRDFSKKLPE